VRRIGVIGGGLAGLIVAYRRLDAGEQVVLFEQDARLGGQLWSEEAEGFLVEHGAEGFVARSEAVATLAAELGIGGDLIGQLEGRSYGLDEGGLRALTPAETAAMLGFHIPPSELGRGTRTFRRGMQQLVDVLAEAVRRGGGELRVGAVIDAVAREGGGHLVGGERVDAVVVTTAPAETARLLAPLFREPAVALAEATVHHSVTVSLAYPREAIDHPLDACGFVVAAGQQVEALRAGTFASSEFPERAPAGFALIRLFFRPSDGDLRGLDDRAWAARAEAGFARIFPVRGAGSESLQKKWPRRDRSEGRASQPTRRMMPTPGWCSPLRGCAPAAPPKSLARRERWEGNLVEDRGRSQQRSAVRRCRVGAPVVDVVSEVHLRVGHAHESRNEVNSSRQRRRLRAKNHLTASASERARRSRSRWQRERGGEPSFEAPSSLCSRTGTCGWARSLALAVRCVLPSASASARTVDLVAQRVGHAAGEAPPP
jgi:oxygen-dependent protoporphyrinogen oxidase